MLHLTRVTSAFASVGNVWFVILWTLATPEEHGANPVWDRPRWILLLGGAVASLGLFAFGTCLNDIIDLRRDRVMRPDRPLASGRLTMETAAGLVAGTLIAAVLGATVFGIGAVLLTLVVAAGIMIFNAAGKFVPAFGLIIIGLIHAAHMLVPNIGLRFILPVWLVMTHTLLVAGISHRLSKKVPRLSRRAILFAVLGWLGGSALLLLIARPPGRAVHQGNHGQGTGLAAPGPDLWPPWVDPIVAVWPSLLMAMFIVLAIRKVRAVGPGGRAAEKVSRYGSLWLTLYACAWLLGAGHLEEGAIIGALAVAGFLGMTFLRELYGWVEQPIGYRR